MKRIGKYMKNKLFIVVFFIIVIISSWFIYHSIEKNRVNDVIKKLSTIKNNVPISYPSSDKNKYLVALQLHRWDIAREILTPLAEKGDPDAIYWLAYISGGNVFSGSNMAEGFVKSAKLGNIYGALQLSPQGDNCSTNLKGICNKKWLKKATDIYNRKKEKGILSSLEKYYYRVGLNARKIELNKDITELVYENSNMGHFQPLIDYINFLDYNYNLDENQKIKIKKILQIPIKKNYIPALNMAYAMGGEYYFDKNNIVDKLSSLPGYCVSCVDFYVYKNVSRDSLMKAASYKIVKYFIDNTDFLNSRFTIEDIPKKINFFYLNSILESKGQRHFTTDEIKKIKENSLVILNDRKIKATINEGGPNI